MRLVSAHPAHKSQGPDPENVPGPPPRLTWEKIGNADPKQIRTLRRKWKARTRKFSQGPPFPGLPDPFWENSPTQALPSTQPAHKSEGPDLEAQYQGPHRPPFGKNLKHRPLSSTQPAHKSEGPDLENVPGPPPRLTQEKF